MPTPLGHGLTGLVLHVASAGERAQLLDRKRALGLVALSVAADFDLLGSLFDGQNHHRGVSHSIGFAVAIALVVYLFGRLRNWPQVGRAGLLAGTAWMLHIAADYLGRDTKPPIGVMLLWPFSTDYWIAPVTVFLEASRSLSWTMVSVNSRVILWETVLLGPVLLTLWYAQRRRLA